MNSHLILTQPTRSSAHISATIGRQRCRRQALQRACFEALEDRRLLSFDPQVVYIVGALPAAITAADFNGDGRLDLVTANRALNSVSVLLDNADGTFQPAQDFATADGPQSVAVGDFNDDGKLDLVTTSAGDVFGSGGNVSVLLGNGDGTFQPALSVDLPGQFPPGYTDATARPQSPASIAVGDINADGKLDLAVTARTGFIVRTGPGYYGQYYYENHYSSYVNVLLGNGDGSFAGASTSLTLQENSAIQSVALEDLNGDHSLDLLLSSLTLDVRLGNGDGTFQTPILSNFSIMPTLRGDFDNDGKLDLVGYEYSGAAGVFILKGQGDGTFQKAQALNILPFGPAVVGDVNADGKLDLTGMYTQTTSDGYDYYGNPINPVSSNYNGVLLGNGDGSFALPIATAFSNYSNNGAFTSVVLGDFNGDSRPDLATTSQGIVVEAHNDGIWTTISIGDVTVTEGNTGTREASFTVSLSAPSDQTVTVNYATADSNATAGADYQAITDTLIFAPGETSKTLTVLVNGDRIGEPDENFFVNLSSPTNVIIADGQGVGTIADDEPAISITNVTQLEGNSGTTPFIFTVTLSTPYDAPVTVDYATANDSATSSSDYQAISGTLIFAPGETSKTLTVLANGDTLIEQDETFLVNLSSPTHATIANGQGIGTIADDEPRISIDSVSHLEGQTGKTLFVFTVTLSVPTIVPVTVNYATANGSARWGTNDYAFKSGKLTFAPGETTKTITIVVKGDRKVEADESFYVNLSRLTHATYDNSQGTGTILDDEPRISIANAVQQEGPSGTSTMVAVNVTLSNAYDLPVTVNYSNLNGSAIAGSDYVAVAGKLTFAPGETSKTIQVQITGDQIEESDEYFYIRLRGARNATIASDAGYVSILDNRPRISINSAYVYKGNSGTSPMTFTITLQRYDDTTSFTVDYATQDGTANAGADYLAASGTLTFGPGESAKTITVDIIGDDIPEYDETLYLNLSNASGNALILGQGYGTIQDAYGDPNYNYGSGYYDSGYYGYY